MANRAPLRQTCGGTWGETCGVARGVALVLVRISGDSPGTELSLHKSTLIIASLLCFAGLAGCAGSVSGTGGGGGGTPDPIIAISGVSVSAVTATSATVMWMTNVSASSRVDYGLTTAYGSNI